MSLDNGISSREGNNAFTYHEYVNSRTSQYMPGQHCAREGNTARRQ